eukprot:CAMPEP_0204044442 /NCGR_PEP_ID=MMETSP0360-20130528/105071_1 /ASSEMBLY_ACC=CAM_ASM_000342 /TAXON_ID=268821 /ORGANISM="Scrippsiella Hangoei, Strain SHTV-5" /LENGTH=142 /DNA_ID=CAMNT_0050990903 /DNA_START=15 /DNA_END=444 /DNA_ORIENTATION=-
MKEISGYHRACLYPGFVESRPPVKTLAWLLLQISVSISNLAQRNLEALMNVRALVALLGLPALAPPTAKHNEQHGLQGDITNLHEARRGETQDCGGNGDSSDGAAESREERVRPLSCSSSAEKSLPHKEMSDLGAKSWAGDL